MKAKNSFNYIEDKYLYGKYFNDLFYVEDDTIIFEDGKMFYSETEEVNAYVNHPYRNVFKYKDYVSGVNEGILGDKKWINVIFDTEKNYAFVENNEVYQLSFYEIDEEKYLAYFKVPEKHFYQVLDRNDLENSLKNKLKITGDTFEEIEIPSENDIRKKIVDKQKIIIRISQYLFNQIGIGISLVDEDAISKVVSEEKIDYNHKIINDMLCIDAKGNFYKISITYLGDDQYKLDYKIMQIKDIALDDLFKIKMDIDFDRKTSKKLLAK